MHSYGREVTVKYFKIFQYFLYFFFHVFVFIYAHWNTDKTPIFTFNYQRVIKSVTILKPQLKCLICPNINHRNTKQFNFYSDWSDMEWLNQILS